MGAVDMIDDPLLAPWPSAMVLFGTIELLGLQ
jgi:hypothetical protein